jgi:hypothetical protein
VVLIDEYDKAITDTLLEPEKHQQHKIILKTVYGALKPLDQYLHLVLITGVSKIGKLSLFSDLNNLQDLSLDPKFATLFGYTKPEIQQYFPDFILDVAKTLNVSLELLWLTIQRWYNGYSWDGVSRVYCPFSFLVFLSQKEFRSFWYATGTPTFLVELIRAQQLNPLKFEQVGASEMSLVATDIDNLDAISLMFQTGYLTIQSKQSDLNGVSYQLGYPNEEVRIAFSNSLLLEYSKSLPSVLGGFGLELQAALKILDWKAFFAVVNQVFSEIPYEIFPRREDFVHSLLHLMLVSTGLKTQSQVQTSLGRMDILFETATHQIIFELKIKGTAKAALQQIDLVHYAQSLHKPVVKVGVRFNLEKKQITAWATA